MSYDVVAEDLTAHGSHLDGLVDRIGTAVSAAETASMSEDAYGLLCSFLPPIINPMEQDGMDALKAAKEGVSHTADNIRTTAKQYEETEKENASSFDPLLENQEGAQTGPKMSGSAPAESEPAKSVPAEPVMSPASKGEPAEGVPAEPVMSPASKGEPAEGVAPGRLTQSS